MNELPKLPEELPRLSVKEMSNETLRFFNFEKGIPFTFISMLKRPKDTVDTYLKINRRKFFNPLNYILIAVGLYTVIISFHKSFLKFMENIDKINVKNFEAIEKQFNISIYEHMVRAQEIIFSYQNMIYLVILPAISLITFWLFRKKYNYAEHLAINAFTFGTASWISVIIALLTAYVDWSILVFAIVPLISFSTMIYIYKKIFETSWLGALGTIILVYIVLTIISAVIQWGLVLIFMFT